MLKKILLGIVALIILVLILAIFIPGEYHVDRKVTINAPKDTVFNYVKYLKNQDNFSTWNKMDPNMKKEFHGTDGTVGAVAGWDSDNKDVGKGEQEIIKITDGQRIDFELRFIEPFEATDQAFITTTVLDSATTEVVWGFDGAMSYPMNLMMLYMNMDKMLGPDLEKGLQNLKVLLEK